MTFDRLKIISNQLNHYLLLGVAVTLPLGTYRFNNLFIILLIVNWLMRFQFSVKNKYIYVFGGYYLLHVFGILYSDNITQALFELEKKIGFLAFPLILYNSDLTKKQLRFILIGFVISCLAVSGVCLGNAIYQYFASGSTEFFFYYPFTEIIGIHPIYLSMYICFSIFIVLYLYTTTVSPSPLQRIVCAITLIEFVLIIFLLSARAEIVAFSLILFLGIIIYYKRKGALMKAAVLIAGMLLIFAGLVYFNPVNRERFKEAINYNSEYSIDKQWGGRALRFLKWSCSIEIIEHNLLWGVGSGDAQDELQKCYEDRHYSALLFWPDIKYNAHNQYLQTAISFGVIGLSLLLACFGGAAYEGVRQKDYLFISFVLLFCMACVTESMLEVNKGINFFTLFASVFLYVRRND